MSTQIFLHIEVQGRNITGEATTLGYEGEIEVNSFDLNMDVEGTSSQTASSKRQARYGNLSVTKYYDKASVNLARSLERDALIDHLRLTVDQHHIESSQKKEQSPIMLIELFDGRIENIDVRLSDGDKGATIEETVKFSYRRLEVTYVPLDLDRTRHHAGMTFSAIAPAVD
ncbi:type VI secretion system tube protein Hcp [Piscinibacter sp. Jin2]|uniref:Type VI secretion system tube protein Hcp n=1 Tax=Aquariibacter lacus TaxID=2801332 RepID=A0A9X0XEC1_9BURK|nr:type VI secretion system tube protein Hcp [Piscinibacter lacus]MBL0718393.1 type VI secretion system tube protein Hcp [Piscinibacter lacus]